MRRGPIGLAWLPSAFVGTLACGGGVTTTGPITTAAASVHVVNAVTGSPSMSVYLNTAQTIPGLSFAQGYPDLTGTYASFPVQAQLQIGLPSLLLRSMLEWTAGTKTTLALIGDVTNGVTVRVLSDTAVAPSTGGFIRLLNAINYLGSSPIAGDSIDVYAYAAGSARPGAPTVRLAWGARSAYLPFAAGSITIDTYDAGGNPAVAPLFSMSMTLATRDVRTVVARDPQQSSPPGTPGNYIVMAEQP